MERGLWVKTLGVGDEIWVFRSSAELERDCELRKKQHASMEVGDKFMPATGLPYKNKITDDGVVTPPPANYVREETGDGLSRGSANRRLMERISGQCPIRELPRFGSLTT